MLKEPTIGEINCLIGKKKYNEFLKIFGTVMIIDNISCRVIKHSQHGYLYSFLKDNSKLLDIYLSSNKMTYCIVNKNRICQKYFEISYAEELCNKLSKIINK